MCIIDHDCALMPFPSAQHDPVNICESMVATKRLNILLGLQVFLNLTGEA